MEIMDEKDNLPPTYSIPEASTKTTDDRGSSSGQSERESNNVVNPFYSDFCSSTGNQIRSNRMRLPADEEDSIMTSVEMNNPITTSYIPTIKGGRPRYFQGSNKPRHSHHYHLKDKSKVTNEFVNFIPAGAVLPMEDDVLPMHPPQVPENKDKEMSTFISVPHIKGKKRLLDILSPDSETSVKKFKLTPEKPATALLNEISPGLSYIYEDLKMNPKDPPNFICKVMFSARDSIEEAEEYVGQGRSKKLARTDAAEKILSTLGVDIPPKTESMHILTPPLEVRVPVLDSNHARSETLAELVAQSLSQTAQTLPEFIDFASDDVVPTEFSTSPPLATLDVSVISKLQNIPNIDDNALAALHLLVGVDEVQFEEVSAVGPPHDRVFTLNVTIKSKGLQYEGKAKTKKKAKVDAARTALIQLLGFNVYKFLLTSSPSKPAKVLPQINALPALASQRQEIENLLPEWFNEDQNVSEYDLTFSDYICRIVNETYEELMEEDQAHISQKVLAGVVMTRNIPMLENGEVVAITTGTKCIEGDFMSTDGLAINDCHAEILATRCLRDYLYSQLELLQYSSSDDETEDCIFEHRKISPESEAEGETLLKLKDHIRFHLYISTSPCGDARIFSPKGLETDEDKLGIESLEDSHRTRKNRGLLRGKVESGEGTIPCENLITGPQTWDSIVQGNALYTMSCSDKVCRMNVVGCQGALLSILIEPIYYSSIVLGSLHHPIHFRRAVIGRIEMLGGKIPLPFKINRPHLLMKSREEKRRVKKSPNHAVCWRLGWSTAEVLVASKGRCEPGGVASRLSKRMAFMRFLKLYKNKSGRRENFVDLSYHEAKMLATNYQTAKEMFQNHMKETQLGNWISKPIEMDSFHISK